MQMISSSLRMTRELKLRIRDESVRLKCTETKVIIFCLEHGLDRIRELDEIEEGAK